MSIEYLPHTADIRMRLEASSLPELFQEGLLGMSGILKEKFCEREKELSLQIPINISATDPGCLMVDFLSEVLSVSYTEKAIFCRMELTALSETNISAKIYGAPYSELDEEIKAVTYHEAEVKKNTSDLWESLILFDI
ncbi:archease [Lentiprolixibacter aurantiacus]|uniref:Archease n=1 Tax=Lentiprolixibacter aurantiacus TaxID=2993939 RepID=A0AAE3SQU4_9FLAO|nr:archease [Lentiprolixibacter aurantiacus]MCX2720767.1 archease [Lentiprolixibacter aurantiacus]